MFLLLLFAGYKAYGHIFFPSVCLAMEGLHGILATIFEHQAAALSAISTIGAATHPKELGLLLAFQTLWLKPSELRECKTMWQISTCWKQHLPACSTAYYAITSVAFRILIWIVELVVFATPSLTAPLYFPLSTSSHPAFWHQSHSLSPSPVMTAFLTISLRFIFWEVKYVQPVWTL